jgi:hypothetical protein
MNALGWLAVVLIIVWVTGIAVFKVVGFAIHLALIAAVLMLVVWAVGKFSGSKSGGSA